MSDDQPRPYPRLAFSTSHPFTHPPRPRPPRPQARLSQVRREATVRVPRPRPAGAPPRLARRPPRAFRSAPKMTTPGPPSPSNKPKFQDSIDFLYDSDSSSDDIAASDEELNPQVDHDGRNVRVYDSMQKVAGLLQLGGTTTKTFVRWIEMLFDISAPWGLASRADKGLPFSPDSASVLPAGENTIVSLGK